jgi:hypothetical protein
MALPSAVPSPRAGLAYLSLRCGCGLLHVLLGDLHAPSLLWLRRPLDLALLLLGGPGLTVHRPGLLLSLGGS